MPVSYKPLWKLLVDKGMTKTEFRTMANLSTTTLAKLGKGEYVSMEVLERICKSLGCQPSDVMEVVKN